MDILTIVAISIGLAMDAFAVSISSGIAVKNLRISHAFRISFFFGSFQGLMPVVGWLAGLTLREYIAGVDHWIAFGLLSLIGGKMIYEATILEEAERSFDPLNFFVLTGLAIATSLDALAVGLSFAVLDVEIAAPAIAIGLITALISFSGVCIGEKTGSLFEGKIEVAGGVILIGIGLKILIEHLFFLSP